MIKLLYHSLRSKQPCSSTIVMPSPSCACCIAMCPLELVLGSLDKESVLLCYRKKIKGSELVKLGRI